LRADSLAPRRARGPRGVGGRQGRRLTGGPLCGCGGPLPVRQVLKAHGPTLSKYGYAYTSAKEEAAGGAEAARRALLALLPRRVRAGGAA